MRRKFSGAALLGGAGIVAGALVAAPVSSAQPANCEYTGGNTVKCSDRGHTRIYTEPGTTTEGFGTPYGSYGEFPYWAW